MPTNMLRKTHPMVLIAAIALTIFSVLGSAAITGLIPSAHSEKTEMAQPSVTNGGESPTAPSTNRQIKNAHHNDSFKSQFGPSASNSNKAVACSNCGVIVSIRAVEQQGEGSGLGMIAGGIAGGLLGNQVGRGNGNTLMTVLGAGGGAYAGHTIEKKVKTKTAYVIKVHMADNSYRTVTQYNRPGYAVGDHVKVNSGQLISA
jgi:outer membrane lipoprotein SlyB